MDEQRAAYPATARMVRHQHVYARAESSVGISEANLGRLFDFVYSVSQWTTERCAINKKTLDGCRFAFRVHKRARLDPSSGIDMDHSRRVLAMFRLGDRRSSARGIQTRSGWANTLTGPRFRSCSSIDGCFRSLLRRLATKSTKSRTEVN